jgi:hypothetical protein
MRICSWKRVFIEKLRTAEKICYCRYADLPLWSNISLKSHGPEVLDCINTGILQLRRRRYAVAKQQVADTCLRKCFFSVVWNCDCRHKRNCAPVVKNIKCFGKKDKMCRLHLILPSINVPARAGRQATLPCLWPFVDTILHSMYMYIGTVYTVAGLRWLSLHNRA